MGPFELTSKRCSTDCPTSELRRFDQLQIQNIYFEVYFLIYVSCTCVRLRDSDIHVDDGYRRRKIGDNLKILVTDLMRSLKYRGR